MSAPTRKIVRLVDGNSLIVECIQNGARTETAQTSANNGNVHFLQHFVAALNIIAVGTSRPIVDLMDTVLIIRIVVAYRKRHKSLRRKRESQRLKGH